MVYLLIAWWFTMAMLVITRGYWEFHHPNWRTHINSIIFQRGRASSTTNQDDWSHDCGAQRSQLTAAGDERVEGYELQTIQHLGDFYGATGVPPFFIHWFIGLSMTFHDFTIQLLGIQLTQGWRSEESWKSWKLRQKWVEFPRIANDCTIYIYIYTHTLW